MKKTIYIHIGTHKTGTTAIQKFSLEHSDILQELGVYYPSLSCPAANKISFGHHLLPWYIRKHPVPDNYYGDFKDKQDLLIPTLVDDIRSSQCNQVVLSSEEFDQLNSEQVQVLKGLFLEFDVKIIVYLRRKDLYVESMYQTDALRQESRTIEEVMKNMGQPLDYFEFVKKWQDSFGVDNVTIAFYCKNLLKSNDIIVDFYDQLGVKIEHLVKKSASESINASIPFHYISAIVMFRRIGVPRDTVETFKEIARMMASKTNNCFHFLSLEKRVELVNSGLKEIEQLDLSLPDKECFMLSDEELTENKKRGKFSALQLVFEDFKNYMKSMENKV